MSQGAGQADEYERASTQPSGKSPEQKWNEILAELQTNEATQADLEKNIATGKDTVTYLQRVQADIGQVLAAYVQAMPTFKKDHQDLERYLEGANKIIDCAVDDRKQEITDAIEKFDEATRAAQKDVATLWDAKRAADEALSKAQQRLDDGQKALDNRKAYQADIEKKFKDVKAIRAQMEGEQAKNHIASVYFLAGELKALLSDTEVDTAEEFKARLDEVWGALITAKKDAGMLKAEAEKAGNEYMVKKKSLDERLQWRRELLLKIVSVFDQPATGTDSDTGAATTRGASS
ncbi:hypothetical protein SAMN05446935_7661 [Burkholderia sp. YR290]|nr:hypothetical protein SAMN05446935_7661 [Burkholderia sp. YR290]